MEQENKVVNKGKAAIAKKIATISYEIGRVKPEGHNNHSNYDFIGYEQVNAILRNKLHEHGLAIIPEFKRAEERDMPISGKTWTRTMIYGTVEIIDTETGESIFKDISGADQDVGGKSFGQACTEAVKRFELKLFHISTKSDIDPDNKTSVPGDTKQKISKSQQNLLIKISRDAEYPNETIKEYLFNLGFMSSAEITQDKYSEIIETIKSRKVPSQPTEG